MDLVFYNGDHSATFGEKNSWDDWHLIPTSKIMIAPPSVKTKVVDIPGSNGSIDLTNVLTGFPTYNNRTGGIEFILAPGFDSWENVYSEVMNYLHGQQMELYLDDDPSYYYQGRFSVNDFKTDSSKNSMTINYDLYPFKKDILSSTDDWFWDSFNFETGVIRGYNALAVDGSLEIIVDDCTEPVMPSVTVSSDMTIVHEYIQNGTDMEDTYTVETGTSIPGFVIAPGVNTFTITGNGTVTFSYRGGRL